MSAATGAIEPVATVAATDAVEAALAPLRLARLRRLLGRVLHLCTLPRIRRRYDAFALEIVHGVPIVVLPGVLNPKLMRTGAFLASHLDGAGIAATAKVLDMGTGSGICAVFAARHAQRVVAVDISEAAVCCARTNALLNGVEERVAVLHGDLYAPLAGERFDLVLFNPPFLRGTAAGDLDRAWRSTDIAERFAAGLADHLTPTGSAYVLLSSFGAARAFIDEFRRHGLAVAVIAQRSFVNERLTLFRVRAPRRAGARAAGDAS